MSANSCLEAIESGVVARCLSVSGIAAAKAVPPAELFGPMNETTGAFDQASRPDDYPGVVVSLNEDQTESAAPQGDEYIRQRFGAAAAWYRVPVYIALYATSDGTVSNAARYLAWKESELLHKSLMSYAPAGDIPAGSVYMKLIPDGLEQILVDANTHGILSRFWAFYMIQQID